MVGVAAGFAREGFIPFATTYAAFASMRCADQVKVNMGYMGLPIKLVGLTAGFAVGALGATHMSLEDVGVVRSIPGMVIFEPVDAVQLRAAMPVLNAYEGPVYVRLFRKELPDVFPADYKFDLFKADVLRKGKDLSIFVTGFLTKDVVDAAETLKAEGIDCEVINVHTIKPIDRETVIASARKTGAVLTVENHNVIGGLHSAVLEALAEEKIPAVAVGVQDRFGEVGKIPYLREVMGLTMEDILAAARRAVKLK
jgi:transketolase